MSTIKFILNTILNWLTKREISPMEFWTSSVVLGYWVGDPSHSTTKTVIFVSLWLFGSVFTWWWRAKIGIDK